ncbi:MAG: hypothetical protein IPO46_09920 [Chitinophagaceae bacterium]|nr:hypothetical protein [Chitinophagaceae bacterium]MBK7348173.1 hypothetical protein [Chitinophagaceae bacterium]MBK8775854.1 hypothetical protein [Chitinophagaceae bacterium]MBK8930244.1 hypothetical protein [Chitinophagaceae bacterium]QQS62426.1 MAG: hypothetical protein IPO46_09920 [Chitinophagaceae bacterium]
MDKKLFAEHFQVVGSDYWQSSGYEARLYSGFGEETKVKIQQHDNYHNRLYLLNKQTGNLHDVHLINWDMGFQKGHEITIVWPAGSSRKEDANQGCWVKVTVKEDQPMGEVLAIRNYNTGKTMLNEMLMRSTSRNPIYIVIPVMILILWLVNRLMNLGISALFVGFFGILLGLLAWRKTWNPQKYNQLKHQIEKCFSNK